MEIFSSSQSSWPLRRKSLGHSSSFCFCVSRAFQLSFPPVVWWGDNSERLQDAQTHPLRDVPFSSGFENHSHSDVTHSRRSAWSQTGLGSSLCQTKSLVLLHACSKACSSSWRICSISGTFGPEELTDQTSPVFQLCFLLDREMLRVLCSPPLKYRHHCWPHFELINEKPEYESHPKTFSSQLYITGPESSLSGCEETTAVGLFSKENSDSALCNNNGELVFCNGLVNVLLFVKASAWFFTVVAPLNCSTSAKWYHKINIVPQMYVKCTCSLLASNF